MSQETSQPGRLVGQLPGGRRTKFAVIAVWLVVLLAIGPLAGKFEDAQENDPVDYLPASAESVETINQLEGFPSEDQADAITVFHRDGGLTAEDRAAIERVRAAINERVRTEINAERPETVAETGPAADLGRRRHCAADDADHGSRGSQRRCGGPAHRHAGGDQGRARLAAERPEAEVTGPAGFAADAVEVFNDINGTLLFATAALVLLLLIVIYRSPIFWMIPFFSVLLAEITTRGLGYLLADAGVTVTGQSGGILPVLVFGAGHRLRAADGLALPRGAAPARGQARRDPRCDAPDQSR